MISFVYFDIGGVLILDFSGTDKFKEMKTALIGNSPEKHALFDKVWDKIDRRVCLDFDIDSHIPVFEQELGIKFPPGYSMLKDFVDRFNPNPSLWSVLHEIRRHCKVGLLTNMYPRMLKTIQEHALFEDVTWDEVVDSSVVGYQKPDKEIFEIAQQKAGVPATEILFVENGKENVEKARSLGWNAFLYDTSNPKRASKDLREYFLKLSK